MFKIKASLFIIVCTAYRANYENRIHHVTTFMSCKHCSVYPNTKVKLSIIFTKYITFTFTFVIATII